MKRRFTLFILILLLLGTGKLSAQNETKVWFFGSNAGLDFNSGSPVAIMTGMLTSIEGAASICDASGSLLFYTSGQTVYNRTHATMTNGTGLMGGGSSVQSSLIVQAPGSSTLYYLFTTHESSSTGLRYSTIDMTASSGMGAVTATKNVLLVQPTAEMLTAVKHVGGTDYWIVTHSSSGNTFYAYRLSSAGLGPAVVSNVGTNLGATIGALKISPDGQHIAYAAHDGTAQLFNFSTTTGVVSNPVLLPAVSGLGYGVEFSANSSVLYCGRGPNYKDIYQYNVCAGSASAIQASQILISGSAASWGGCFQLGPDGKIYFGHYNTNNVGCINSPNTLGAGCNYVDNAVSLGGRLTTLNLPNFMTSYFFAGLACTILPSTNVRLSSNITAERDVLLQWQLDGVSPPQVYAERSADGIHFSTISGNLSAELSLTDYEPEPLENYYRLLWKETDGSTHYTEVVTAHFTPDEPTLKVFPQPVPAGSDIHAGYYQMAEGAFAVLLCDAQGKVLFEQQQTGPAGYIHLQVPAQTLAPGIYFLKAGALVSKVVIR